MRSFGVIAESSREIEPAEGRPAWQTLTGLSLAAALESTRPGYGPLSVGLDRKWPGIAARMPHVRSTPSATRCDTAGKSEDDTTEVEECTFGMSRTFQPILKQAMTSGVIKTLNNPTSTMAKPATEPSSRPNSWAFAVPAPWAPTPRSAPRAIGE